jgi:progressive ankylosis protein
MKRVIFWLWLPLALSMTLMMLEGPTVQGAIGRLPDPALSLAAFGTVFGIALIIESPVIMFVSTAIALVNDAQSYYTLRRFVITVNLLLTLLTALVAWTPLFALITGDLLGLPPPIVATGRPMLQLLVFFTAAVGWRRFYQGILVRYGYTRRVTYGTAMRLLSNVVAAVVLVAWGRLSGASAGAIVLMVGVLVEAVVTYTMAIAVVRAHVLTVQSEGVPLSMTRIVRFHTPLAATSLLSFLAQPLTVAALARLQQPQTTLAAWPVIFSVLLILRGWGLALQEITIFQARDLVRRRPLRDFSLLVAGSTSLAALLLSFTPLLDGYIRVIIGLAPDLEPFVRSGVRLTCVIPALTALTSWQRGLVVVVGSTGIIYRGMVINVGVNALSLALGVVLGLPGIPVAALGLTAALIVEFAYLQRRTLRAEQREPGTLQPVEAGR